MIEEKPPGISAEGDDPWALRREAERHIDSGSPGLSARESANRALSCYERALAVAEVSGDRRAAAWMLRGKAETMCILGDLEQALGLLEEAAVAGGAAGDREFEAMGLAFAAFVAQTIGVAERALDLVERAVGIAADLPIPFAWIYCRTEMVRLQARAGQLQLADAILDDAIARLGELPPEGQAALRMEARFPLGDLYRSLGRPQDAVAAIELTLAESNARGIHDNDHLGWRWLGHALLDLGDTHRARAWLGRSLLQARALANIWHEEGALALLAELTVA